MVESDPNGPLGECLAEGYDDLSAADAVKAWVAEKPYYDHASNKCVGGECGHYTQPPRWFGVTPSILDTKNSKIENIME
ncbi:hypothetical protein FH972_004737 [Carpinus fangiana]|uniref:Uncharacterized protein n=1 Tax=Carpinus fangiana TaxID=176857 RepID=A0A5N6QPJ4_9ROSI|nr:hypothetical protein FH972_004737 [Carpinus fangiana]